MKIGINSFGTLLNYFPNFAHGQGSNFGFLEIFCNVHILYYQLKLAQSKLVLVEVEVNYFFD